MTTKQTQYTSAINTEIRSIKCNWKITTGGILEKASLIGATVKMSYNGELYITEISDGVGAVSFTLHHSWAGLKVDYTVSKEGYETESKTKTIPSTGNWDENVNLNETDAGFFESINFSSAFIFGLMCLALLKKFIKV